MNKQKLYILSLAGQGDVHIRLVEEDCWEWINQLMKKGWKTPPPQSVLDKKSAQLKAEGEPEEKYSVEVQRFSISYGEFFCITSGSGFNDAALTVPAVHEFYSIKESVDFLTKHPEIEIVDSFEGAIY